jgi:hypothetical protein
VCIAMLESNGYDLKTSIEAFFQSKWACRLRVIVFRIIPPVLFSMLV